VAVVAAPDVEREQMLGHGGYALFIFALPLLGAALLEASVALLSERWSRRHVVGWGLCAASIALALCAASAESGWLAFGLTLAGAAAGMACTAAQIELVAESPGAREQAMTRWVLCGGIGDVLTPVFVALVLKLDGSYRAAFGITAVWALVHGVLVLRAGGKRPPTAVSPGEDDEAGDEAPDPEDAAAVPLARALRESLTSGRLWLALLGSSLCLFLDEVVVAFAALHAESTLGASPATAVACVSGGSIGAVFGAWYTERLLARVPPDRVLYGSACGALVALLLVVVAPGVVWLGLALALLGAMAAPQYALLQAKAYSAVPGRPGVVNAIAHVFVVVEIGAPLLLGALADASGVRLALVCLGIQPLGVLLVLLAERRQALARRPAP
jgi:MFS family permease